MIITLENGFMTTLFFFKTLVPRKHGMNSCRKLEKNNCIKHSFKKRGKNLVRQKASVDQEPHA